MDSIYDEIESDFETYLQQTINNLQNQIAATAENGGTSNEFDDEEENFMRTLDATRNDVNRGIDQTKVAILSKRPNPDASDEEKSNYRKFLRYSANGLRRLQRWINRIFSRLIDIIKTAVMWIWNNVADIARKIRDAFKSLFNRFFVKNNQ
jgi:hypothetical protein